MDEETEMKVTPYDEAKYLDTEEARQGYLESCREFGLDIDRANEAVERSRKLHGSRESSIISATGCSKAEKQNLL